MPATPIDLVAAGLFALALLHTFSTKHFERLAHRFPRHAGIFHLLGEVEVVFGFWAIVLVLVLALVSGGDRALAYAESRQYTEPLFVFVVMVIAASRPILHAVWTTTDTLARMLPLRRSIAFAWLAFSAVPLFGSTITEPAAMTIAALMLKPHIFRTGVPERLKYFALAVLFVNVSIGGTLSAFAAPPVLMVASAWGWTSTFMMTHLGWKAALAVLVNASMAVFMLRSVLTDADAPAQPAAARNDPPFTLIATHLAFLAGVVALSHHPVAFLGLFLMFLGVAQAYPHFQSPLIFKESLLVAFFLAGLVVLGGMQQWWLQPIVADLAPGTLFLGATALTAVTDNAALTYLGSLISGLSDSAKYQLVAGAVAGGGLTVIANAPNPAGVALLKEGFADGSVGAMELLLAALLPTLIAALAFTLL